MPGLKPTDSTEQLTTAGAQLAGAANRITADLGCARPSIYWTDLLLTAALTWASLAAAVEGHGIVRVAGAALGVLALYRAVSFIHELTHLRESEVPGFRFAWNVLVGVPFLVPSLLYEGVHSLHHARPLYGTAEDPEYVPLSHRPPATSALFLAVAALGPLGALIRFGLLAPLSFLSPRLRAAVTARYSALCVNPAFRRQDLARARSAAWRAQEIAAWAWSWGLVGVVIRGGAPARWVLTGFLAMTAVTVLNQVRTLAAHAWTSDGRPMSVTEQYLDTVNVPPPGWLPLLWAPVGLRYHALHHLLPRIPYHGLAEAHRRLAAALPPDSPYHRAHQSSLTAALRALFSRVDAAAARSASRAT
jgi:fatty acid desaturase